MSKRKYFENKVVRGGYSREMPTLFFFIDLQMAGEGKSRYAL
jgi:hypothetical protein